MSPGPGAALSALSAGGGSEAVVRGELVQGASGPSFVALRKMRWGTEILTERPLLLVEPDTDRYLRAADADPRLVEIAHALGDGTRLAAYVAFRQLQDHKQKEVLGFWRDGLEESDPVARALHEENRLGIESFLEDHPHFRKLIYWNHVVLVASIFGRFGVANPDGSRAIYRYCSHIRHSCRPNAAWFTLRHGYPKGKKKLHVIDLEGIRKRGEEITVSMVEDTLLLQPKVQRNLRLAGVQQEGGCPCSRCTADDEEADERIRYLMEKMAAALATRPPSDSSTTTAQDCLKELDQLLPFSMPSKAKAKALLASVQCELLHRAAWQEDNKSAHIIRWTGLDADSMEQRLKDTQKLCETAAKDFQLCLGQDFLLIEDRLEKVYALVKDQHELLAKYRRQKENAETAPAEGPAGYTLPEQQKACAYESQLKQPGMPPTWEELFSKRP